MPADPTEFGLPPEAVEDVSLRTRDSKTFVLPGGKGASVIGLGPLHFQQTAGGPWLDPSEMVIQRSAPGTWTVTTTDIHIAANYGAMQITHRPTNQSWQWNFLGQGSGDSIIYQGIPWQYEPSPWGVKSHATVTERRGPQVYQWTYNTNIPSPTVDAEGNIVAGRFVIPRPFVVGADGERYECGGWELAWPYVRFAFDDTALPPEAFPYVIDPTTHFDIATGSDAGFVERSDFIYPPTGFITSHIITTEANPAKSQGGSPIPIFSVRCALFRWNTSGLPPGVVPTRAWLSAFMRVEAGQNADNRALRADWVDGSSWPISSVHWTALVGTDAINDVPLSTFPAQHGQNPIQIELDNVAANINPNGYTALRLGISGGQPTGLNQVRIAAYAAPLPLLPPRLIIEYAPPTGTLSGTVTDASTSAPIAGATVALDDDDESSTQTDAQGEYTLEDIAPGEYTATYSASGYVTQQRPVEIVAGDTTFENVALQPAATPLPLASGRIIVRGHGLTLAGGPADLPLASGVVVVRGHGVEIQGGPIDLPLASGRVLVRGHGVEIVPVAPPLTLPALHRPLVTVGTAWHVPVIELAALHRPVVTIGGDMHGAMGASNVPLELAITPGEARTIRWEVRGIDGQPETNMSGWTMTLFILHNRRDANGLTELANRAILVKDATPNAPFAVVEFSSEDTLKLPAKTLEFELWRIDDGDERRLAHGQFPVVS